MKKAFTLIELLVVVLIIGILSSIALPQYQRAVEKARAAEAATIAGAFMRGADMYLLSLDKPSDMTYKSNNTLFQVLDINPNIPSKYTYWAFCNNSGNCSFAIRLRKDPGWGLYVHRTFNNSSWNMYCYWEYTSKGKAVCEGLKIAGYQMREGSVCLAGGC